MDLWTAGNAPVQRIKVEPELKINDDWVTYPIEARVMEARVPDGPPRSIRRTGLPGLFGGSPKNTFASLLLSVPLKAGQGTS